MHSRAIPHCPPILIALLSLETEHKSRRLQTFHFKKQMRCSDNPQCKHPVSGLLSQNLVQDHHFVFFIAPFLKDLKGAKLVKSLSEAPGTSASKKRNRREHEGKSKTSKDHQEETTIKTKTYEA
jgi:hypothetical protein